MARPDARPTTRLPVAGGPNTSITWYRPLVVIAADLGGRDPEVLTVDWRGSFEAGTIFDDEGFPIQDLDVGRGSPAVAVSSWLDDHPDVGPTAAQAALIAGLVPALTRRRPDPWWRRLWSWARWWV